MQKGSEQIGLGRKLGISNGYFGRTGAWTGPRHEKKPERNAFSNDTLTVVKAQQRNNETCQIGRATFKPIVKKHYILSDAFDIMFNHGPSLEPAC